MKVNELEIIPHGENRGKVKKTLISREWESGWEKLAKEFLELLAFTVSEDIKNVHFR